MKIYSFTFPGHWLGGRAVVLAENEAEARESVVNRIREKFSGTPLEEQRESLTLENVFDLDAPRIVYFDNGDY